MLTHKYIQLEYGFIVFPETFEHSKFKFNEPIISAGFCSIDTEREVCYCFGGSVTLGIRANEDDSQLMRNQFFGVDRLVTRRG